MAFRCRPADGAAGVAAIVPDGTTGRELTNVTAGAQPISVDERKARVEKGMSRGEVSAMMSDATIALGGNVQFSGVLLNESSAYPHGPGMRRSSRKAA